MLAVIYVNSHEVAGATADTLSALSFNFCVPFRHIERMRSGDLASEPGIEAIRQQWPGGFKW